jgi:hypothetical protein
VSLYCRYRSTYTADPSAYKVPSKTGGGYWFEERQRAAAGNTVPFSSSTTYAAEMLQGQQTEQQQKQCVAGLPDTLVGYKVARDHRCAPNVLGVCAMWNCETVTGPAPSETFLHSALCHLKLPFA